VCVPLGATFAGLLGIRVLPLVGWRTLFLMIGGVVPVLGAVALLGLLRNRLAVSRVIRGAGPNWPARSRGWDTRYLQA
jgi:hypothetical protein